MKNSVDIHLDFFSYYDIISCNGRFYRFIGIGFSRLTVRLFRRLPSGNKMEA